MDADALLFAVPLYNFGVEQHFKTWFDVTYTDERLSAQAGTLRDKPATLVTTLAGNDDPGTPKEGWTIRRPGCAGCWKTCGAWTCGSSSARSPWWA